MQAPTLSARRKPPLVEPDVVMEVSAPETLISASAAPEASDWWHALGVVCVIEMHDGGSPGWMSCNMAPPTYSGGIKYSLLAFQVRVRVCVCVCLAAGVLLDRC